MFVFELQEKRYGFLSRMCLGFNALVGWGVEVEDGGGGLSLVNLGGCSAMASTCRSRNLHVATFPHKTIPQPRNRGSSRSKRHR